VVLAAERNKKEEFFCKRYLCVDSGPGKFVAIEYCYGWEVDGVHIAAGRPPMFIRCHF
jgi:hypothetical protein